MQYAIMIEKGKRNYSAYAPDLPGCVATGRSLPEVKREMQEAIQFHIDGLHEEGLPVPKPTSRCAYVTLAKRRSGRRARRHSNRVNSQHS
jgi:predicted RNase H-like HicB family nuclease